MAYAPKIQSKNDLKQYILRQLGSPVVNIEITTDQMDDAIDNALELYMQNAYSGVVERFIPLVIQQGDPEYIMPYEVFAITSIRTREMGGITNSAPSNIFSMNQFIASDLYRGGKVDLLSYEMTNELLATLDIMFSKRVTFDFNCISKTLHLFEIPVSTETAMVQCYIKNVPTYLANPATGLPDIESTNIYNELWVRRYTVELCRRQWADNLTKYEGSQLPNGMVMNASAILTRAEAEIVKLEEMLYTTLSIPCDFFIG